MTSLSPPCAPGRNRTKGAHRNGLQLGPFRNVPALEILPVLWGCFDQPPTSPDHLLESSEQRDVDNDSDGED
jgi:hypothetical protein